VSEILLHGYLLQTCIDYCSIYSLCCFLNFYLPLCKLRFVNGLLDSDDDHCSNWISFTSSHDVIPRSSPVDTSQSTARVFNCCLVLKFVGRVLDVDDVRKARSLSIHRVRLPSVGRDRIRHRRLWLGLHRHTARSLVPRLVTPYIIRLSVTRLRPLLNKLNLTQQNQTFTVNAKIYYDTKWTQSQFCLPFTTIGLETEQGLFLQARSPHGGHSYTL